MLALEIELEEQLEDRSYKVECLSKLLQMYMVTILGYRWQYNVYRADQTADTSTSTTRFRT